MTPRARKFLLRVTLGFLAGLSLGIFQLGSERRVWPVVFEYGVVLGALAFAVTNYLELRQKLLEQVRRSHEQSASGTRERRRSGDPR